MADSEAVLTQEQIDAMLAGGTVEPSAQRSAAAEAPEETPVKLTPTTVDEVRANEAQLAAADVAGDAPAAAPANGATFDLSDRVARLEAAVSQGGGPGGQDMPAIMAQLQDLSAKVESLMTGMQGTVGYGARQTFVCRSCQNQGNVAAKLNCTSCGEENWWGWWPPQQ